MSHRPPINILFLCTGNSCRSVMCEAWCRAMFGSEFTPYSAGTRPQGLNPLMVRVMKEAGVDIREPAYFSKHVDTLASVPFDLVVTVCDSAHEACPVFPNAKAVVHRGFDDPPKLAEGAATDEEALPHYCRVRDQIKQFVSTLPSYFKGASH